MLREGRVRKDPTYAASEPTLPVYPTT